MKIKYICKDCKGDNLCWDGVVKWDVEKQNFVLADLIDDLPWCQNCGESVNTIEIPLSFDELKIL